MANIKKDSKFLIIFIVKYIILNLILIILYLGDIFVDKDLLLARLWQTSGYLSKSAKFKLITLRVFLARPNVKIIIFGGIIGGTLQILSRNYLENHPEILTNLPQSKKMPSRGGELVTGSTALAALWAILLPILSDYGIPAGVTAAIGLAIRRTPASTITKYCYNSIPQEVYFRKNFIMVEGGELNLNQCSSGLKYLFDMLEDKNIPFNEREELAKSITKYVNLDTLAGRVNFILCLVFMLSVLFTTQHSSFYLLIKSLIQSIREGKIPKSMGRFIVKKLKKKGLPVDPELIKLVAHE